MSPVAVGTQPVSCSTAPCRDGRTAREIGRSARLELTFGCRADRTVLAHAYAEPPYRLGRPLPDKDGLHIILASTAPGIFGGDSLRQSIAVEPGARVRLTSQSSLQVHASDARGGATIQADYTVGSGARLTCEWDASIPFPDAQLDQRIRIDVSAGATLFWSDALMAGREARGERWKFSRLAHELQLIRADRLRYLERYDLNPLADDLRNRWTAGDFCYFGTILAVGPVVNAALAEATHRQVTGYRGVLAGGDWLDGEVLLVRLASADGASFHAARRMARDLLHRQ
jgi:urease accessory protein